MSAAVGVLLGGDVPRACLGRTWAHQSGGWIPMLSHPQPPPLLTRTFKAIRQQTTSLSIAGATACFCGFL